MDRYISINNEIVRERKDAQRRVADLQERLDRALWDKSSRERLATLLILKKQVDREVASLLEEEEKLMDKYGTDFRGWGTG